MAGEPLPDELIEIIILKSGLKTESSITRFRAVCRSWRSRIPPFKTQAPQLSCSFQMYDFSLESPLYFYPTETAVYHVASPTVANKGQRGWLIRLDTQQKRLLPPLTRHYPKHDSLIRRPQQSNKPFINALEFNVFEVAKPYLLGRPFERKFYKLAVSLNPDFPAVMMIIGVRLYHAQLGGVDVKERNPFQLSPLVMDDIRYSDDVIFYQGKFLVVNTFGRAVLLHSDMSMTTIAAPIFNTGKNKKSLVESLGELLLVERHESNFAGIRVKFKVYKLDEPRKRWIEMQASDLNDRILFVGEDCCFSVAIRDFPGCQGSCIYFCYYGPEWNNRLRISPRIGQYNLDLEAGTSIQIGVFNLYDGKVLPLESYPASANIFLPPPNMA